MVNNLVMWKQFTKYFMSLNKLKTNSVFSEIAEHMEPNYLLFLGFWKNGIHKPIFKDFGEYWRKKATKDSKH